MERLLLAVADALGFVDGEISVAVSFTQLISVNI